MRFKLAPALAVAACLCAAPAVAAAPQGFQSSPLVLRAPELQIPRPQGGFTFNAANRNSWRPIFTTLPPRNINTSTLQLQAAAAQTIPFFSSTVTSPLNHKTFPFTLVGSNPLTTKVSTTVSFVPIILILKFDDGTVLDPTKPGCGDSVSVTQRFFNSPLFRNANFTSNGIAVGNTQFTDAFQRASFWSSVQGTNFHVLLSPAKAATVILVKASGFKTVPGVCPGKNHNVGLIDINSYDQFIQQEIVTLHVATNQLPIFLTYNLVLPIGTQCCALGYHSAFGRGSLGTQTYSVGSFLDTGLSSGARDVSIWSHEFSEWMDDPFANNATPAWGHTGQVTSCQANLEVGDPLTGTLFPIVGLGGFTYHIQDEAFFDWFFRTPSKGTRSRFSFAGTFNSVQGTCK